MTARKTVTNVDVLALKSMVQVCAFASVLGEVAYQLEKLADDIEAAEGGK